MVEDLLIEVEGIPNIKLKSEEEVSYTTCLSFLGNVP